MSPVRESLRFLVESPVTRNGGTDQCLLMLPLKKERVNSEVACVALYQLVAPLALPCPPCPLPRLFPRWSSARTVCDYDVTTVPIPPELQTPPLRGAAQTQSTR